MLWSHLKITLCWLCESQSCDELSLHQEKIQ